MEKDYKQKKLEIKQYFESKICSEREKDCIKYLWGRKPKPYGFKKYHEIIVIHFD